MARGRRRTLARGAAIVVALGTSGARAEEPARLDVALHVREDAGVARESEPIASGVPLPRGAVLDPGDLRVIDPKGRAVPCQAHQLGLSWPDGSLRWALVQLQASVGPREDAVHRLVVDRALRAPAPTSPARARDRADGVEITTGPLRLVLSRADFHLPTSLAVRAGAGFEPVLGPTRAVLRADREHMTLADFAATGRDPRDLASFGLGDTGAVAWGRVDRGPDGAGRDHAASLAGPARLTIEESGPLRVVVRAEPVAPSREGDVGYVARVFAYAGRPFVRVEYTLASYERLVALPPAQPTSPGPATIVNGKHVRELSLRLAPARAATEISFGAPDGPVRAPAAASPSIVQLDATAFSIRDDSGAVLLHGERAPGWATARVGRHAIGVATRWFWETAPRGFSWDAAARELAIDLRPPRVAGPGYPIPGGRVKTYAFTVGVDVPGERLAAMERAGLRALPDPAYVAATGAAPRFVPLDDKRLPSWGAYARRTRELAAAARLFGDVDFGDQLGWSADQRWNGYHGRTHEWFVLYLASGDPELFRVAEAETWHGLDVDTEHWGDDAGAHEAEYGRAHDHVVPAPWQGGIKVFPLGEIDDYLLTGDRRVLESLRRTTAYLLRSPGLAGGAYLNGRASSLPFLHLVHLYEVLGDESALAAARPSAMKPGAGRFRVDSIGAAASAPILAAIDGVASYFHGLYDRHEHVRSAVFAPYPAEAFHRWWTLTGDPRAAAGVLKAARFLYDDLTLPTGSARYAGGAPWEAHSPWTPWWDGVESPAALAWHVTGDRKLLDLGKAPVDWILHYRGHAYSSGAWSFQGAMGYGPSLATWLWAAREAGLDERDLDRPRADLDLAAGLEASRAECLAHRARAFENGPESSAYCRLAAEIGRVLVAQGRYREAIEWLEPWSRAPYGVFAARVLERARALAAGAAAP